MSSQLLVCDRLFLYVIVLIDVNTAGEVECDIIVTPLLRASGGKSSSLKTGTRAAATIHILLERLLLEPPAIESAFLGSTR
jgi:hypothetical protein